MKDKLITIIAWTIIIGVSLFGIIAMITGPAHVKDLEEQIAGHVDSGFAALLLLIILAVIGAGSRSK